MGNSMNYSAKPLTDCYSEDGFGKKFSYGSAIMQGWRRNQEDRYICIPAYFNGFSFFGVYDGHGGAEIAEYLKRELHLYIQEFLKSSDDVELALYLGFLSCDESIKDPETQEELNEMLSTQSSGVMKMLRDKKIMQNLQKDYAETSSAGPSSQHSGDHKKSSSKKQIPSAEKVEKQNSNSDQDDEEVQYDTPLGVLLKEELETSDSQDGDFSDELTESGSSGDETVDEENSSSGSDEEQVGFTTEDLMKAEPGGLSGSTATVVLITDSKMHIANVGDSRCVLSRKGQAIDLSLDHKPEDDEERSRIIGSGATISEDGRVNDCLNLSRAFGDFEFKNASSIPIEQAITAEPFINTVDITDDDEFLLVASDGIWNSMSSQEVVDFVNIRLKSTNDYSDICDDLFHLIIAPDKDNDGTGCDNMSCIIVKLGETNMTFSANESGSSPSAIDVKNSSASNSTSLN